MADKTDNSKETPEVAQPEEAQGQEESPLTVEQEAALKKFMEADEAPRQRRGGPIQTEPQPENPGQPQPWKPASLLHVFNKDPNYTYMWKRVGTLEKALAEGWETVKSTAGATAPKRTLMDGTTLYSLVQKRGLVLCRMPKQLAEARAKYYADLTDGNIRGTARELESAGHQPAYGGQMAYGGIKVDVR